MTNYHNRYYDGYDDINKDGNNDDNYASKLRSFGLIFDPITTPWSCGGLLGDDGASAAAGVHTISMRHTTFLPYKDPIKYVP